MQPKLVSLAECPCARAVETVGEWWSILILRDALQGLTRFDEFERRRYRERPARHEYVLTAKGRDFFPVVAALVAFGNRHLAPEGEALLLAERGSARPIAPVLVDAATMRPITAETVSVVAGPKASPDMLRRLASIAARAGAAPTE